MPEIHVLPKDISELIAAGEVIERPASVLKELTENAVDSGAKHITAELKRGGVLYLRVTDDGCGIAPEQVKTAFLRHATSKIREKEDLESILTLGFRGEALASVCAVSRTELLTRQKDSAFGTHYVIESGEEQVFEQSGCPEGTTIVVRDLFYNVPVRAGFLKKDTAEGNAAALVFQKIALSHPEISFRLIRENKTEFVTPGDGTLYSAIYAIFGKQFAGDLLPVHYEENPDGGGITIDGFVIKPLYARANRAMQLFFVNGRAVRSGTLCAALEEAYKTLVMTGKFPACVLQMQISPRVVDVNMHPTKAEVRFSDEKRVFSAVYFAAMNALSNQHLVYEFQLPNANRNADGNMTNTMNSAQVHRNPMSEPTASLPAPSERTSLGFFPKKPKVDWYAPLPGQDSNTPGLLFETKQVRENQGDLLKTEPKTEQSFENCAKPVGSVENLAKAAVPPIPEKDVPLPSGAPALQIPMAQNLAESDSDTVGTAAGNPLPTAGSEPDETKENTPVSELRKAEIRVIGELFENYILAEADDQFVMIDKHAAHERILFERFRSRRCTDRQSLLTPIVVLLTAAESDALREQSEMLGQVGFTFSFEELPIVKLTGVPLSCAELDLDQIVIELAEQCLSSSHQPDAHLMDDYFHTLACKAAIRSGDRSDPQELQALAKQVWQLDGVRHCPHGRPVMFLLSKYKIEKQFQRIV